VGAGSDAPASFKQCIAANVSNATLHWVMRWGSTADLKTPYVFMVETPARQYRFCCESEEIMLQWGRELSKVINKDSILVKVGSQSDVRGPKKSRRSTGMKMLDTEAQLRMARGAIASAQGRIAAQKAQITQLPHPALGSSLIVTVIKAKGLAFAGISPGEDVTVSASLSAPSNESVAASRAGWPVTEALTRFVEGKPKAHEGFLGGVLDLARAAWTSDGSGTTTSGKAKTVKATMSGPRGQKEFCAEWSPVNETAPLAGSRDMALRLRPPATEEAELHLLRSAVLYTGVGSSIEAREARSEHRIVAAGAKATRAMSADPAAIMPDLSAKESSKVFFPSCFLAGHTLTIVVTGRVERHNAAVTIDLSALPLRPHEPLELDLYLKPGGADDDPVESPTSPPPASRTAPQIRPAVLARSQSTGQRPSWTAPQITLLSKLDPPPKHCTLRVKLNWTTSNRKRLAELNEAGEALIAAMKYGAGSAQAKAIEEAQDKFNLQARVAAARDPTDADAKDYMVGLLPQAELADVASLCTPQAQAWKVWEQERAALRSFLLHEMSKLREASAASERLHADMGRRDPSSAALDAVAEVPSEGGGGDPAAAEPHRPPSSSPLSREVVEQEKRVRMLCVLEDALLAGGSTPMSHADIAREGEEPEEGDDDFRDCLQDLGGAAQSRALIWTGWGLGQGEDESGRPVERRNDPGTENTTAAFNDSPFLSLHMLEEAKRLHRRRRLEVIAKRASRVHRRELTADELEWTGLIDEAASDISYMSYDSDGSDVAPIFEDEEGWRKMTGPQGDGPRHLPLFFLEWQEARRNRAIVAAKRLAEPRLENPELSWRPYSLRACRLLSRVPPASPNLPLALKLILGRDPRPKVPQIEVDIQLIKIQDWIPHDRFQELLQFVRDRNLVHGLLSSHGHAFPHPLVRVRTTGDVGAARPCSKPERVPLPLTGQQLRRHASRWDRARRQSKALRRRASAATAAVSAMRDPVGGQVLSPDKVAELRAMSVPQAEWLVDTVGSPPAQDPRSLCWGFDSTLTLRLPSMSLDQLGRAVVEIDLFDEAFANHRRSDVEKVLDAQVTSELTAGALGTSRRLRRKLRRAASQEQHAPSGPSARVRPTASQRQEEYFRKTGRKHLARTGASGLHIGSIVLPLSWLMARTVLLRDKGGRMSHPMWVGFRPAEWMLQAGKLMALDTLESMGRTSLEVDEMNQIENLAVDVSAWAFLAVRSRINSSSDASGSVGLPLHRENVHAALRRELREYKRTGRLLPALGDKRPVLAESTPQVAATSVPVALVEDAELDEKVDIDPHARATGFAGGLRSIVSGAAKTVANGREVIRGHISKGKQLLADHAATSKPASPPPAPLPKVATPPESVSDDETDESESETDSDDAYERDSLDPLAKALQHVRKQDQAKSSEPSWQVMSMSATEAMRAQFLALIFAGVHIPRGVSPRLHWCVVTIHRLIDLPAMDPSFLGLGFKTDAFIKLKLGAAEFSSDAVSVKGKDLLVADMNCQVRLPFWTPLPTFATNHTLANHAQYEDAAQAARLAFKNINVEGEAFAKDSSQKHRLGEHVRSTVWVGTDIDPDSGCTLSRLSVGVYDQDDAEAEPIAHSHMSVQDVMSLQREQHRENNALVAAVTSVDSVCEKVCASSVEPEAHPDSDTEVVGSATSPSRRIRFAAPEASPTSDTPVEAEPAEDDKSWADVLPYFPVVFSGPGGKQFLSALRRAGLDPSKLKDPRRSRKALGFGPSWVPLFGSVPSDAVIGGIKVAGSEARDNRRMPPNTDPRIASQYRGAVLLSVRIEGPDVPMYNQGAVAERIDTARRAEAIVTASGPRAAAALATDMSSMVLAQVPADSSGLSRVGDDVKEAASAVRTNARRVLELTGALGLVRATTVGAYDVLRHTVTSVVSSGLNPLAAASSLLAFDYQNTLTRMGSALESRFMRNKGGMLATAGKPTAAVWSRRVPLYDERNERQALTRYTLVVVAISGTDIGYPGANKATCAVSFGPVTLESGAVEIEAGRAYWAQVLEQSDIVMPRQPSQLPDVTISVSIDGGRPSSFFRIPASRLLQRQWRSAPEWFSLSPISATARPRITNSAWAGHAGSVCLWIGLGRSRRAIPPDVWRFTQQVLGRKPPTAILKQRRAEKRRLRDLRAAELMGQAREAMKYGRLLSAGRAAIVTVRSDDSSDEGGEDGSGGDSDDDGYSSSGSMRSLRGGGDDSETDAATPAGGAELQVTRSSLDDSVDLSQLSKGDREAIQAESSKPNAWEIYNPKKALAISDLHWPFLVESALSKIALYQVRVHVYQARHLPAMDRGGTSDVYVHARLAEDIRTSMDMKVTPVTSIHPRLSTSLRFDISLPPAPLSPELLVEIFDANTFAADVRIGCIRIPLFEADEVDTSWLLQQARKLSAQYDASGLYQLELNPNKALQRPKWHTLVVEPSTLFRGGDGVGLETSARAIASTRTIHSPSGILGVPGDEASGSVRSALVQLSVDKQEQEDTAFGEGLSTERRSIASPDPFAALPLVSWRDFWQESTARRFSKLDQSTHASLPRFRRALARALRRTKAAFDFDSSLSPRLRDLMTRPGALMAENASRVVWAIRAARERGTSWKPSFFEIAAMALAFGHAGMVASPEMIMSMTQGKRDTDEDGEGPAASAMSRLETLLTRDLESLAISAAADVDADRLVGVSEPAQPEVLLGVQLIRRVMDDAQKDGVTVGGRVPMPLVQPEPLIPRERMVQVRLVVLHVRNVQAPFGSGSHQASAPLSRLDAPELRIQLTDQHPTADDPRALARIFTLHKASPPEKTSDLRDTLMGFLSSVAAAVGIASAASSEGTPPPMLTMSAAAGHHARSHHSPELGGHSSVVRTHPSRVQSTALALGVGFPTEDTDDEHSEGGKRTSTRKKLSDVLASRSNFLVSPATPAPQQTTTPAAPAPAPPRLYTPTEVAEEAAAKRLLPSMPESDEGLDHISSLYVGRTYFCSELILEVPIPLLDHRRLQDDLQSDVSAVKLRPASHGRGKAARRARRAAAAQSGVASSDDDDGDGDGGSPRRRVTAESRVSSGRRRHRRNKGSSSPKRQGIVRRDLNAERPTVLHEWIDQLAPRLHCALTDAAHSAGGAMADAGAVVGEASIPLPWHTLPFPTVQQYAPGLLERADSGAMNGGWGVAAPMVRSGSGSQEAAAATMGLFQAFYAATREAGETDGERPSRGLGGIAGSPHVAAGKVQEAYRTRLLANQDAQRKQALSALLKAQEEDAAGSGGGWFRRSSMGIIRRASSHGGSRRLSTLVTAASLMSLPPKKGALRSGKRMSLNTPSVPNLADESDLALETPHTATRVRKVRTMLRALEVLTPHAAGGSVRRLQIGRRKLDASVFDLTASEAMDVRREDVGRDLPHWMRDRLVLRCALGALLPESSPVFKDFALFRPVSARNTGSARPAGFRQSGLLRAHMSIHDPKPRWEDLEPLTEGFRRMRDAGKDPPKPRPLTPAVETVLGLASCRQRVTVRLYALVARFSAGVFFPEEESARSKQRRSVAHELAIANALDELAHTRETLAEIASEQASASSVIKSSAFAVGDVIQEGASSAAKTVIRTESGKIPVGVVNEEDQRLRSMRRRGITRLPKDLPDDAPFIDAASLFRTDRFAPERSRDSVFARVHLQGKGVQGKAYRPVLVPAGSHGRQIGFEVRRAEGGAGGGEDAAEVDLNECFELDCILPDTALLVIELFRQRPERDHSEPEAASPSVLQQHAASEGVEFLGGCVIDLEHRWLHPAWHNLAKSGTSKRLPPVPLETRLLRSLDGRPAGAMQLWCDIIKRDVAMAFPPIVVAPPPPVAMELRVVVWRVRGMEQLGYDKWIKNDLGGFVPFFVRGWLHNPSIDYHALTLLADAEHGEEIVEYPQEQRTSTGVAIPCGEAAELAHEIETKRGASAKNDSPASACATIGEMGFVPPLYFAKIAEFRERAKELQEAKATAATSAAAPPPAASVAASASAITAAAPGDRDEASDEAVSEGAAQAAAEAAEAERMAHRYLPQSMWPGGGGPRPEDRVLPQAMHMSFNWRMSFPVTYQRWGRLEVPGPLVLELCEARPPRRNTREYAEIVARKSVGCLRSCGMSATSCCTCCGGIRPLDIAVDALDVCGQNTAVACGATRWKGRGGAVVDFTKALKQAAEHPDESRIVVPGPGYRGVSNALYAMAWVPLELTADIEDFAMGGGGPELDQATGITPFPPTVPDGKGKLQPHSLKPAMLVSIEVVPLGASSDFAKAHGGKRPGLGRSEPNDAPYLKDPGAITRQIQAAREKNRKRHCCSVM
jgi:hypothetical protein